MRRRYIIITMILLAATVLSGCGGDYNGPKLGGTTTTPPVDTTPPTVLSTSPVDGATNVVTTVNISATFSEPVITLFFLMPGTFTVTGGGTSVAGTISQVGNTVTFSPTAALTSGATYTATISSSAVFDLFGNPMAADKIWTFTTAVGADTTGPTVFSIDPVNLATGVSVTTAITAVFDENLAPASVNGSTFLVSTGGTLVTGTVSVTGANATFAPSPALSTGTTYSVTLTTGITDVVGNALSSSYVWSFTTVVPDTTPPTVLSTSPVNNDTNVAITTKVTATFSEAINCATVTTGSFTLMDSGTPVAGTIWCLGDTAQFTPSSSLTYSTLYTATVSSLVTDVAGNLMAADYIWSFTTAAVPDTTPPTVLSTSPASGDMNAGITTKVTATFSEAINCATVTTGSFTLMDSGTPVAGTIWCLGDTAQFTPSSSLTYSTLYTATVSSLVTDVAGNPMTADYVWSFTTEIDAIPPTVLSTTPATDDTNVALATTITAVFSEAIDCASVTSVTFVVQDTVPSTVAGTYSCPGNTVVFTPSSSLASGMVYTVTITTIVTDLALNGMTADYVWSFTTI